MELTYTVKEEGLSVKSILTEKLDISRRLLTKLKQLPSKHIFLNSKEVYNIKTSIAKIGDIISVDFNYEEDNSNIIPVDLSFSILYENAHYLVVNKPANMPVHPSQLHFEDSLSNAIKFYFDSIRFEEKNKTG